MRAVILVLLMSASLQAQDHDYLGHALLVAGNTMDLVSTRVALSRGATEVGLVGSGFRAQLASKVALTAMVEGLSWAAARDGHPLLASRHRKIWGVGLLAVSAWNFRVAARQRR